MKKSKKGFILLGITSSIIAVNGIMQTIKPLKVDMNERKMLGYNHNPTTALDNVFEQDGMLILPFIYDNAEQKITKNDIITEFYKAGLTIKDISTGEKIGTGTKITVNENSNVYTVLVYGDVTGDGVVNLIDAQKIISFKRDPSNPIFLIDGIYHIAGNVQNTTDVLDLIDAQKIIMFKRETLEESLVKIEPISIKEKRELTSISAVYDNSVAVSAATTLEQIKPNIVVKAHYSNGDIEEVTAFELTGNLIAGQDNILTITVSGKTTSITVTVAERELVSISAKYDDTIPVPVTTSLDELKANIEVTGVYNNGTTSLIKEFELEGDLLPGQTNTIKVTVQGKETMINVTVEADAVSSIELEKAPDKNKYNYGEEKLDLTGGKIKVNWVAGNQTSTNITSGMISGYNPKQEGPQEITITYGGATTTFEITVLDRISALEIIDSGRTDNVTVVSGGYKVDSKAEFILGTIQAEHKDTVSELNADMLTLDVELNASDDAEATKDSLSIEKVVDADGNVMIKGKAATAGTYTVNVILSYEDKTVTLPITVQAVKSSEIKKINLNMDKDDLKVGKPLRIDIEVININDEKITPDSITFENITNGLEFAMFDSAGNLIEGSDLSEIAYIEVSTTIESAQAATFTIKATISKNSQTSAVTLQVKDAPVVTSIVVNKTNAPLYIEEKEDTKTDENGNIYTVLDVEFFDQTGDKMEVEASNIQQVTEPFTPGSLGLTKNQIVLIKPKVTVQRKDSTATIETSGLYSKLYDAEGNEATGNTVVSKIGIAIITDSPNFDVVLSSIDGKNIKFVNNLGVTIGNEIPLQVIYKALTTIRISEEGQENVIKGTNGIYNVELNKEFILGTITVGANEGPLTADMLTIQEPKDGLTISYEMKDGKIIVKGTVTKAGTYSVRPITTDGLLAKNSMNVKAEAIPTINNINLGKETVEIGRATEAELIVETDLNPTGETITAGDIKIECDSDIVVTLLNEDRDPIADGQLLQRVKYLKLEAKELSQTDNDNVNLTITVFDGKTNAKSVSKTIKVYQPIPRAIEIDNTVTLYGTANSNTMTSDDGLNYTLLPIKAWADTEKTKPVVITREMFGDEFSSDILISIAIPKVNVIRAGKTVQMVVIKNAFFDKDKDVANTGDIEYIGFAKINLPSGATLEENALEGVDIEIKCNADNGQTAIVTTSYSEN